MRKLIIVALATVLTTGSYLSLPVSQAAPVQESAPFDHRLLAVGAGAIVGIVAFNMLTYSLGPVPFVVGSLAEVPIDIALGSRLLATLTGGAGALAAHYLYPTQTEQSQPAE